jgi:putative restriction endonuclease
MFDHAHDSRIRTATFDWLTSQVTAHPEFLSRTLLERGFLFEGTRIHVVGPQGIFKPGLLQLPLSITTSPDGPYEDKFGDQYLRYRYRGRDPEHRDNRGLREAMTRGLPLVHFYGLLPNRYLATWPVFIVGDNPRDLAFTVAVDDTRYTWLAADQFEQGWVSRETESIRRAYITSEVRVRLHQTAFRERVLEAYQQQCAFCRLRHQELLEAAHIIPDNYPEGEPLVPNGMALCSLHHRAFDRAFLGLRPDYTIEVRPDILIEKDGPTLAHAIQALHGSRISLPRTIGLRPDPERIAVRYKRFRELAAVPVDTGSASQGPFLWD